jgi:prepilin-type N-terminal cleavage/methylation domain-containing protein
MKLLFHQKGMTLPELLLAASILAFAIAGILLLFVNCSLLNESNRNLTIAASHAQFVMEDIKNSNFATLQADIDAGNWNWTADIISAQNLTPLDNESIATQATGAGVLDITVTVLWQDRNQRNRQFILETALGGI